MPAKGHQSRSAFGGRFGAVVAADELGMPAAAPDDLVQAGDRRVGVDAVVDEIGERLTGELVDHVEDLDGSAGGGDIELIVQRPHVVGPLGPQPLARRGGITEALALAALRGHSQALLTP